VTCLAVPAFVCVPAQTTVKDISASFALIAISKGMWAVKTGTNKILQFLTAGAG